MPIIFGKEKHLLASRNGKMGGSIFFLAYNKSHRLHPTNSLSLQLQPNHLVSSERTCSRKKRAMLGYGY